MLHGSYTYIKKEQNLHKWYILLKPTGDLLDGIEHICYSEHQMHPHFTNYFTVIVYCFLVITMCWLYIYIYIYICGQNLIDT
jgi:hypothetical protein